MATAYSDSAAPLPLPQDEHLPGLEDRLDWAGDDWMSNIGERLSRHLYPAGPDINMNDDLRP